MHSFQAIFEAAGATEDAIKTAQEDEDDEHTLTGFTVDETHVIVAKLLKNNKTLFLNITSKIFDDYGILNLEGKIEEEIVNGVTNAIKTLDDDDFQEDVKDMMFDISSRMMKRHPKFVNKMTEKTLQELFKYLTVETQGLLMSGKRGMDTPTIILVMNAYNKFMAGGGPNKMTKFASRAYPVLVNRLCRKYGRKYKRIIQRMANRRMAAKQDEADRDDESISTSSSASTITVQPQGSEEEMGQF